jgi:hypothetical protein
MLKQLPEAVREKRSEPWPKDWILHHKTPAHRALSVKQFLGQKSITEMKYASCSPYLGPNDFWLFPKMKSAIKGRRFQDIEDIKKKSDDGTRRYLLHDRCFTNVPGTSSIAAQGEYFEGDPFQ